MKAIYGIWYSNSGTCWAVGYDTGRGTIEKADFFFADAKNARAKAEELNKGPK